MSHRWIAAIALLGLSLTHQVDASSSIDTPEAQAVLKERVALLSAREEPQAWLLAAWFAGSWCKDPVVCGPDRVRELGERLLADPPEEPGVLRVLIGALPELMKDRPEAIAGERERLVRELQRLDPDHLKSWLLALPDPKVEGQRAQAEKILARAALASRVESDFTPTFRWMRELLSQLPPTPVSAEDAAMLEEERLSAVDMEALALVAAIATPESLRLSHWCQAEASAAQADCQAIGRLLMTRGDTLYDRRVGISLSQTFASSQAEREEISRERARVDWYFRVAAACPQRDGAIIMAAYAEEGGTEIAATEALLLARGLPLEPPADPLKKIDCELTSTTE